MSQEIADILSIVFGTIAILMTIAIEFSQILSIFKTNNTSGTSLTTYGIFFIASSLWLIWASLLYAQGVVDPFVEMTTIHVVGLYPAIISNAIGVIFTAIIFALKLINLKTCKKLGITELELAKRKNQKQANYSWWRKYYGLVLIAVLTTIACVGVTVGLWFSFENYVVSKEQAEMYKWGILGFNIAAAIFFEATSWPQFIKSIKTKELKKQE